MKLQSNLQCDPGLSVRSCRLGSGVQWTGSCTAAGIRYAGKAWTVQINWKSIYKTVNRQNLDAASSAAA